MNALLEEHSLLAESDRRQNCLVCSRYFMRDGQIFCKSRLGVQKPVAEWTARDYARSVDRAQKCKQFDDMRPGG